MKKIRFFFNKSAKPKFKIEIWKTKFTQVILQMTKTKIEKKNNEKVIEFLKKDDRSKKIKNLWKFESSETQIVKNYILVRLVKYMS